MNEEKAGGVAFPCAHEGGQKGMTLRDYFAAQVMAQCVSRWTRLDQAAADAYEYADAMLAERAK